MQLDLHVSRFDWAGGPSGISEGVAGLAARAEAVGIRTLSFMDHYFQMESRSPAEDPMLEAYTALGYVAGLTQSLRLRVLVTGVTYRHPGLLAKIVTTLDVLSGGRAELGLGAAWYEREHRGLGVPFPPVAERFERLEEALQICLQMWSPDNGPYQGKHYQLAETLCSPMPVSTPRPRGDQGRIPSPSAWAAGTTSCSTWRLSREYSTWVDASGTRPGTARCQVAACAVCQPV